MRPTVLFLESSRNIGGQELQIIQQIQQLTHRGWRAILICKKDSKIFRYAKENNIEIFTSSLRNAVDITSILNIRTLIKKSHPRALILHSGHDAIIGAIAAKLVGSERPRIIRMKTYLTDKIKSLPFKHLFDNTYTCSQFLRSELSRQSGIPEREFGVLYPGIDFEKLSTTGQSTLEPHVEEWIAKHPGPLIVHGAILREEKGHATLIKAIYKLRSKIPDIRYIAAGEGPLKNSLLQLTKEFQLEDNVYFPGMVSSIGSLLKRASLAVLPSKKEPLGMFQIEALQMGVPTIASAIGGIPETIQNKETGLLVPPDDVEAWAENIAWALSNIALMRCWAAEGGRRNSQRFGICQNTDTLISIIANTV